MRTDKATPAFPWKRNRSEQGVELFHYPSNLAQQLWCCLHAIGHARCPSGFRMKHPTHNRYLLHYVRAGEMQHRVGTEDHVARAGEACLLDLSQPVEHGTRGSRAVDLYWVSFNGKDMPRYFAELRADRSPVVSGLETTVMENSFRELILLTQRQPAGYEAKAGTLLSALLAELYSARVRRAPLVTLGAQEKLLSAPVRKGIDFMARHYDGNFGLKQVCDAAGVSLSHFSRRFHEEVGMTPIGWLNQYRVEQAKRLLIDTLKPAGEIARLVGIADPGYFARLFHQLAGLSPREYRNRAKR